MDIKTRSMLIFTLIMCFSISYVIATPDYFTAGNCNNCTKNRDMLTIDNYLDSLSKLQSVIVTQNDLIIFYPFSYQDSNSTFTKDYSSHGYNGNVLGATFNNTFYSFDGGDIINISSSDAFDFTSRAMFWSMSFWVYKIPSSQTGDVVSKVENSSKRMRFTYGGSSTSNASVIFKTSNGVSTGTDLTITNAAKTNSWQHVLITCNDTARRAVYFNGVLNATSTGSCNVTFNNTGTLQISGYSGYNDEFRGYIDDFMFLNRSLNHSDALNLYQVPRYYNKAFFNTTTTFITEYIPQQVNFTCINDSTTNCTLTVSNNTRNNVVCTSSPCDISSLGATNTMYWNVTLVTSNSNNTPIFKDLEWGYTPPILCSDIIENYLVTRTQTWPNCSLTLTDPEANGAIIISNSNIVLDCNGTTLKGNRGSSSKAIKNDGYTNVTIKNCNFDNYYITIYVSSTEYMSILNNSFNVSVVAYSEYASDIYFTNVNKSLVAYNYHMRNDSTTWFLPAERKACYCKDECMYNVIDNNRIYLRWPAIYLRRNSSYNNITNNIIGNVGRLGGAQGEGIYVLYDSRYVLVKNNFVQNCSRNCINFNTDFGWIINNTVADSNHDYIDLRDENPIRKGVLIENNTIFKSQHYLFHDDQNGIWLDKTTNCTIKGNRILNLWSVDNNATMAFGIGSSGGAVSRGNVFINNYIENVSHWIMRDLQSQTTFINNTMKNCTAQPHFRGDPSYHWGLGGQWGWTLTPYFDIKIEDNNWLDGYATYGFPRSTTLQTWNISINETSTLYHKINFSNDASVLLNYSGRKQINMSTNAFTIKGLQAPYNNIYDKTNNVMIAYNVTEYSIKTSNSQEIQIGNYTIISTVIIYPEESTIMYRLFNSTVLFFNSALINLYPTINYSVSLYDNSYNLVTSLGNVLYDETAYNISDLPNVTKTDIGVNFSNGMNTLNSSYCSEINSFKVG